MYYPSDLPLPDRSTVSTFT